MWSPVPVAVVLGWAAAASAQMHPIRPITPRNDIYEHSLKVVDSPAPPREQQFDEWVTYPAEWDWPGKHLQDGARFVDSFIAPEIFPEVSVGTAVQGAEVTSSRAVTFQSQVVLSLWALEVRVPVVSTIDREVTAPLVQFDLKVPFALPGHPDHRLMLTYGAAVLPAGPALSQTSRGQLFYGYGSKYFSLVLHAGYGVEQLYADQPPRPGFLYGGTVGLRLGAFQPMVEADGIRTVVTRGDRLAVVPGIRFFPDGENLQIGVGALLSFAQGEDSPGRRLGAVAELSYNFL